MAEPVRTPPSERSRTSADGAAQAASAAASPPPAPATIAVRIWDLPTRLFHWSLVVCVAGSLISVNLGGMAVGWHFRFGYAILALLLFRLLWGFLGPRYARFGSFRPDPVAAWRYLRGRHAHLAGHSPLGALSVYALLLVLAFQAISGLFASDAIMWDGPLRARVSNATSDRLTSLHHLNSWLVYGLVLLHLVAIAWYAWGRREPLVAPMITGDRKFPAGGHGRIAARDGTRERLLAAALMASSAAVVWFVVERIG